MRNSITLACALPIVIPAQAGTQMRREGKNSTDSVIVFAKARANQRYIFFTFKHLGPRFRGDDKLFY